MKVRARAYGVQGMIEAARKDGKIYFYDPQNEKRNPERFIINYFRWDYKSLGK